MVLKQEFGTDVYIILDLQIIGVNTRIKKGLIRVISIAYLGFAFLLFAGNYAIYVISKKWLQVVLMQESTTLISVINLHFSEIEASGTKSATTAIQNNPAYCISLLHKEI